MRCAVLFTSLLLLSTIPLSTNVTADNIVIDSDTGITISSSFDNSTEITTLFITVPETDNSSLLDLLRTTNILLYRVASEPSNLSVWTYEFVENFTLCSRLMLNSECSGNTFEMEVTPNFGLVYANYLLATETTPGNSGNTTMLESEWDDWYDNHYIAASYDPMTGEDIASTEEYTSNVVAVENLTASYSDGVTDLTWAYPDSLDMNHSIMIYSHYSPATRENWDSMPKTIVSSSVTAGTTSYQINHSGTSVEREIYYSATLLYPTSEDTRFIGSNTLTQPVIEDNVAPVFVGELEAYFNPETSNTIVSWQAGLADGDISVNIYRHEQGLDRIDSSQYLGSVDYSQTSFEIVIPMGEHRQTSYAITLQDSQGNEKLELTESSPVSDPIVETTIGISTVRELTADRNVDGTITISWEDYTNNQGATARIWRSIIGPIESMQDVEELGSTNVSSQQFSYNPVIAADDAWYAVTIEAAWGSEQKSWHDESVVLGVNSLQNPLQESEEMVENTENQIVAQLSTTSGFRGNLTDGSIISLGSLYEGDYILISTSEAVQQITCQGIDGLGTSVSVESDWILTLSANQTEEECIGMISTGDNQIGFTLTWNFIGPSPICEDGSTRPASDGCNSCTCDSGQWVCTEIACTSDDENTADEDNSGDEDSGKQNTATAATVILTIIILALLIYLLVMVRTPEYSEEE